ncbi:phosphomevalonate kinase [Pseudoclavibacter soli]|uniref:phosphomevalonate kinase n=1 Tax=Pseudoclavibacter soli TaxID=452623 RepID=UPI00041F0AC8|nr:phosphomevalonate kinase [Pseudoclavibacter soli]
MTVEVAACGKLYVAGEYAVVEPGQPAVLVGVDRHVTVRVDPAETEGHIRSDQYDALPLTWHRDDDDLVIDPDDAPYDFVLAAIRLVEEVARARDVPLRLFDMSITSELDDASGRKFGLGSSAAVTVATVRALAEFYSLSLQREQLLRLSLLATIDVQRSGSGGDVAASLYGGWIAYTAFDRQWARSRRADTAIDDLLAMPWPGLSVRRLTPPTDAFLVVGWTGTPASTARLVSGIQARKDQRTVHYHRFLQQSAECVNELIAAFDRGDLVGMQQQLRRDRQLLSALSEHTGVVIETPLLEQLADIAERFGGAGKSSGAGGGDCGIVLIDRGRDIDGLEQAWRDAGIRPLDLVPSTPESESV